MSRSVDDSGNLESPPAGVTVNVTSATHTCPCSIWKPSAAPAVASAADAGAVEIGLKFRSDVSGVITGLRFYKGAPTPARTSATSGRPPASCSAR